MRLRQWLSVDLKRLFRGRGLILATLLMPIVGMLVFGSVLAPMLAIQTDLRIPYAICNMDKSKQGQRLVSMVMNSESLREMSKGYPVPDEETGCKLLQEGRVGVLVCIPADFYQTMSCGEDPSLRLISYPEHGFDQTMVRLTLDGSLRAIGQSQNLIDAVGAALRKAGADETAASALLEDELTAGIEQYVQRRASLVHGGTVSPEGELFPAEHYLSVLFSLFAALAMLPSLHLTASDLSGNVLRRGLLTDTKTTVCYFTARLLSGAALILLTMLLLFPVGAIIQGIVIIGRQGGAAKYLSLMAALLLTALCFSALSLLIAGLVRQPRPALWCGFFAVLLMAALSGISAGEGMLPAAFTAIGRWMPLKPAMGLIANVLFRLDQVRYVQDTLRLTLLLAVFLAGGFAAVRRAGGAKCV